VTRHLAKLKKLKWSSKPKELTLEDFQYQFNKFCKKSTIVNNNKINIDTLKSGNNRANNIGEGLENLVLLTIFRI